MNKAKYKIIRCFNSEKGASSVLVVLILLVLIVLGLAALTTSLASLRLGERSGEWYKNYYILDAKAERQLGVIDRSLNSALEMADAYIDSGKQDILPIKTNNKKEFLTYYYLTNILGDDNFNFSFPSAEHVVEIIPSIKFKVTDDNIKDMELDIELKITDDYEIKIFRWIERSTNND